METTAEIKKPVNYSLQYLNPRSMTQEQAQRVLDLFSFKILGHGWKRNETSTPHQRYEALEYTRTHAEDLVPVLETIELVATQRRKVDESDLQKLDTCMSLINHHLEHDACTEKAALALRSALLGALKPARGFAKGASAN